MKAPGRETATDRWLAAGLAAALLAIYAEFHQARDWNTASRLMLTYSLVQRGEIEITPFVASHGRLLEHPQTRDLARDAAGRYFCDKAPGQSYLGAGWCWMALRAGVTPQPVAASAIRYWWADYFITLGTSGLLAAVSAAILFLWLRQLGAAARHAMAAGLALGLATILLPYATLFYGHVAAGFFGLLAIWILDRRPGSFLAGMAAGFAAGTAVTIEYPMLVLPIALLVATLLCQRSSRAFVGIIVGGIVPALFLAWYHQRVTGAPFRFPYSMEVQPEFRYHTEGIGIPIGWPRPEAIGGLLFAKWRGLLTICPVLMGALPGLWILFRQGRCWLGMMFVLSAGGLVLLHAGFPAWEGGWATGPRFLVPAAMFLSLPMGIWLGWAPASRGLRLVQFYVRALWALFAVISGTILFAYTVGGGRVPPGMTNPLRDFAAVAARTGTGSSHLGLWLAADFGLESADYLAFGISLFPVLLLAGALWMWAALTDRGTTKARIRAETRNAESAPQRAR